VPVKGDCNCKLAYCGVSGELKPWSTVFETGVSDVITSRQQNYVNCRQGYEPGVMNECVPGDLL
jgi:hypothetical protein